MSLKTCTTLFFLFISMSFFAQPYLIRDQSIVVKENTNSLSLAWLGGLNNPQFSAIDFNEDQIQDLFIFDKSGGVIIPLIQVGNSGSQKFTFDADYIKRFPEIKNWALLRDFNCDGYPDIFTYSNFGPGAMVYKNNGQVGNEWYSISDSLLLTYIDFGTSNVTTNLFISKIDIPIIYDYDYDGDLDIFSFNVSGFQLEFYKNFSLENGLGCDFDFELKNRCWGYFGESLEEDLIVLGQDCSNVVDPERKSTENTIHSGSTLLMLDIDGNGEQDVVMGDVSFDRLTALLNGGPSAIDGLDSIVDVNYEFPDVDNPGSMNTFPGAYYEDVNNDQLKDLIVAPNAQFVSDNMAAIKLYLNTGANDHPNFEFQTNAFLQEDMIDIGEGSYPVLIDVNQDGLTDLLIGNRKRTIDSIVVSSITYYKNTGSAEVPQFELITGDYFEISELDIGEALYPTFMDMNGDQALDMLLGNLTGNLFYLINQAPFDQPFDFSGEAFELTDNENNVIDVGQLAKPQAVDLNNDSIKDLAIGSRGGTITYFENTGSISSPQFTWITDSLGYVRTPGYLSNTGYSSPFFYKEDSIIKLIVGSETGELLYYTSIINNLNGVFEETTGPASEIREGMRSVPARGDLNNDQIPDLMLGNYRGGLSFFKGDSICTNTDNPVINCPEDIKVSNDAGVCDAVVNYVAPVGTDNCPGAVTVQTDGTGLSSGDVFPLGTTRLEYTVTNANGLTAACNFNITVVDSGFVECDKVLIYPNPAYDQLTIEVIGTEEFEVGIFNGIGQSIFSEKHFNSNKTVINVSGWASGSYIVEIEYDQKHYVYHLIKVTK